ncbi:hypothetical protein NDA11_005505 [Ustilago hordei]|nr:hypothetical protein NDA15_005805 [Ustilago hordei]KAJ1571719.1 hypothetical protein NDA12_000543 [Ustilago hordei]KAJ1575997.1 hypothetical protein NDA11_005505 [Ustilago hordei]UTT87825.1 hypothetical protein NDA17_007109 [Ustilago hordei]
MAVAYPRILDINAPVFAGEHPCPFKVISVERSNHYVLVAVDESDHEFIMAQSSAVVYPPRVAMAPRNVPFIWRFERA